MLGRRESVLARWIATNPTNDWACPAGRYAIQPEQLLANLVVILPASQKKQTACRERTAINAWLDRGTSTSNERHALAIQVLETALETPPGRRLV